MTQSYESLAPNSKVWVYQSNRNFTETETQAINQKVAGFTQNWAAHGSGLQAYGKLHHQRFLVLMVDESRVGASGCSIDSSVHLVKELGQAYQVDFFDRLSVVVKAGEELKTYSINGLKDAIASGELTADTPMFNNLVKDKADWEQNWLIPIGQSWLKTKLKSVLV